MPSLSKQKVLKAKEAVLAKSMEKGKEKEKDPSKANRKTTEPPLKGAPKKKLLASAIHDTKRVEVWSLCFIL